jgi:hypothetical protein
VAVICGAPMQGMAHVPRIAVPALKGAALNPLFFPRVVASQGRFAALA